MKKLVIFAAIFASAALLLAGCGTAENGKPSSSAVTSAVTSSDTESVEYYELESMDVSVLGKGREFEYGKMTLTIPEGFEKVEDDDSVINFCSPTFSEGDPDRISIMQMVGDGSIDDCTKENMTETYRSFVDGFGEMLSFQRTKIDSYDALRMCFTQTVGECFLINTQYVIFCDGFTENIAYSTSSGKYTSQFETCITTVKIKS